MTGIHKCRAYIFLFLSIWNNSQTAKVFRFRHFSYILPGCKLQIKYSHSLTISANLCGSNQLSFLLTSFFIKSHALLLKLFLPLNLSCTSKRIQIFKWHFQTAQDHGISPRACGTSSAAVKSNTISRYHIKTQLQNCFGDFCIICDSWYFVNMGKG